MIEVLDLFSAAAGGWSLGLHRAGFTTIAACEVEAWRRAIYSENNPNAKVYDDVRTLTAERLLHDLGRLPSIVVGSPPCQDISSANTKGRGVAGSRSGLYFEAIRIIGEVRPRWFALENSANLRTRGYDALHPAGEAIGYTCWPFVVRAGDVGANHERARCWLLGCDLEQVADADRSPLSALSDLCGRPNALDQRSATVDATSLGHEGGWTWGHRADGFGTAPASSGDAGDASEDGCPPGLPRGYSVAAERLRLEACGDASHAYGDCEHAPNPPRLGRITWTGGEESLNPRDNGCLADNDDVPSAGDAAHADETRQADGRLEPGLRSSQIADHGCCAGRSHDRQSAGQVDLCAPNCGHAGGGRADWTLGDLADHLRLDDGLSARLAGTRVALGAGKGQSAASLIVEAFGDAVIPQIPEAIGRAILRTEAALAVAFGGRPL